MKTNKILDQLIDLAIMEDISTGDLATESITSLRKNTNAVITAKANGVISGIEIAELVLSKLAHEYSFIPLVNDGDTISKGQDILKIEASYDKILIAERLMLNFMQRMSGIATQTRALVNLIEGTRARLLDTRKTVPGHRITDKLAVKHGGGFNHRMGLFDLAMLKDNHIKAAGGILEAISQAKQHLPVSIKIEVETTNLEEVKLALEGGADIIMLDNMSPQLMTEAVGLINGKAKIEASGNITAANIREVAETGVDYISVGAITHSVHALDMSLYIIG